MSELLVYKASAGSGKTFRLAVEYIKLLVQNPQAYRNILAVTFTNKATGEMKERILSQLYGIFTQDKGSRVYLETICKELDLSPEVVRSKAGEALLRLIHDYSRFQVSTIDSFFQAVMRNLARELGLGASMNIELDTASALNEAVDKIVNRLDRHSPVFFSLLEYIQELISDDKNWNIIDSIKKFGQYIFNEEFMEQRAALHEKLRQPDFFGIYRKLLKRYKQAAEDPLQEVQEEFFNTLERHGLHPYDLKGGKSSIASYFRKLKDRNYSDAIRNKTVEKSLADIAEWKVAAKSSATLSAETAKTLQALLVKAEELRQKNGRIIHSVTLSMEYLHKVGLLATIDEEVHRQNVENNRFLLAETNILLRQLVQDADSSFVFEKIGTNIRHVMIDEFQDTSRLQWKNFRMLLLEGLSQGSDSLIVGDVKQAIYRWRSGDWSILGGMSGQLGAFPIRNETLQINRRSEQQVINFNNRFFTSAIQVLNAQHEAEQGEPCTPLLNAYNDVEQIFPKEKEGGKGYVKVSFMEGEKRDTYTEETLKALVEEVRSLQEKGVAMRDIVILVRTNGFIPLIADYFEAHLPDCPIVSNEAFRLDASQALKILIEAMRCLSNPDNRIAFVNLIMLSYPHTFSEGLLSGDSRWDWQNIDADTLESFLPEEFIARQDELKQLSVYELLERLSEIFRLHLLSGQDAYLLAFFDAVLEYSKREVGDLDSFLSYWDGILHKKTVPSEEIEGIRVYTIHSSKGLEFHTVIVPFCHWKMENEMLVHTVWCTPPVEPFNRLNLLPVNYGSQMNESVYHADFLRERLGLWVDNLNVLYVAFTRATKNLIIMGQKRRNGGTVSKLMQDALQKMGDFSIDLPFEIGELYPTKRKKKEEQTNLLVKSPTDLRVNYEIFRGDKLEFRQSNSSAAFIRGEAEEDLQESYIRQGNLLHRLFSEIRTAADVTRVLQRMEVEGLFTPPLSVDSIRKLVERALGNRQAACWFEPGWEVFNECTLVYMENGEMKSCRPDRVMRRTDGSEVIVVDFKFGKPDEKYKKQVRKYISRLQAMGYKQVSGYLWYVYKNKVEEVVYDEDNK